MDGLFAGIAAIYIFLSFIAFGKWYEYKKEKELQEFITWAVTGGCRPNSYYGELLYAIRCAQNNSSIDESCRICDDIELEYVLEIIEKYQIDLMRLYLKGYPISVESKYVLYENEYFMFTFYEFLSRHQSDYEFAGHEMSSDFGTTLHKLHYIAFVYCKNNEKLKNKVGYWTESELKNVIYERVKK